jgi:glycosyltransferase involved in cell wall biosynthesis/tetratricopeptide (TPR) repeat protein
MAVEGIAILMNSTIYWLSSIPTRLSYNIFQMSQTMTVLKPLVSIIVPVFNIEQYVEKCFVSILNQSSTDIECIIVDDASTDRSIEIIQNTILEDKRFRIITKKQNSGLPAARNTGLKEAIGRYILHVDGDDFLSTRAVEKLLQRAERDQSDVVWGAARTWPAGVLIRGRPRELDKPFRYADEPELWVWGGVVMFLFRADFIRRLGIKFNEKIQFGEDKVYLSSVLPKAKRISYVYDSIYFYRSAGGITSYLDVQKLVDMGNYVYEVSKNIKNEGSDIWNYNLISTFAYRADLFALVPNLMPKQERHALFDKLAQAYRGARIDLVKHPRDQPWRPVVVLPSQLHGLFISLAQGNAEAALLELSELSTRYLHPNIRNISEAVVNAKVPLLEDILQREPRNARLLHEVGCANMRTWNFGVAEVAEAQALRSDPMLTAAYTSLSVLYARRGHDAEALAMAQRAVELENDSCSHHVQLGKCALKLANLNLAVECCAEALAIDSNSAEALSFLSEIEEVQGSPDALKTAARGAALAPDNRSILHSYASMLVRKNLSAEAVEVMQKWSDKDTGNMNAKFVLGGLFVKIGRTSEAVQQYNEILDLYPNRPPVLTKLATVLIKENRLTEAVEVAKRAIDAAPYNALNYTVLERALTKLNKVAEARREYERSNSKAIGINQTLERTNHALKKFKRRIRVLKSDVKGAFTRLKQ